MKSSSLSKHPRAAVVALATALCLSVGVASAQDPDHPVDQPLTMAIEVGFAPFAMTQANGETVGFSVDVCNEIASRLGRPGCELVDVPFSAIFSGLFSKRYEGLVAPTNITETRAQEMLYTEGYMAVGLGFMMLEDADFAGLEGLAGKVVAVNNGNLADTWATEHADEYGFTVQRLNTSADAVQAVLTRRAFTAIADLPGAQYAATQTPRLKVGHVVDTGRNYGLVFRKDDVAFRNQVERILEAMKLDGTFAEIHVRWFGDVPGENTAMNIVWGGYGPPGFPGYSPEPHLPGSN